MSCRLKATATRWWALHRGTNSRRPLNCLHMFLQFVTLWPWPLTFHSQTLALVIHYTKFEDLWDHLFLSYAADKQKESYTQRDTDEYLTSATVVSTCKDVNIWPWERDWRDWGMGTLVSARRVLVSDEGSEVPSTRSWITHKAPA